MKKLVVMLLLMVASQYLVAMDEGAIQADRTMEASAGTQKNYLEIRDPYDPEPTSDDELRSTELFFACDGYSQPSPKLEELLLDQYIKQAETRANNQLISFLPHWYTLVPASIYVRSTIRDDIERTWFKFVIKYQYSLCGIWIQEERGFFPVERMKAFLMRVPGIVKVSDDK